MGLRPLLTLLLVDEQGCVGRGDAAPLPGFSPESVEECEAALTGVASRLDAVDDAASPGAAVAAAINDNARTLSRAPSACLAVETALFDLVALRRGLSLAECLGASPPLASIPANALLYAAPEETLAERAVALQRRGYVALKVKLCARTEDGFHREIDALRETRRRLPLPFELRVDLNAALDLGNARQRMRPFSSLALRYVEQPVAPFDLPKLDSLDSLDVPWAADESLVLPELVEPLLRAPGCVAFVLKPTILGGLLRTRSLALRALEHGKAVVITHLFDGPLAMAAAAELAFSLPAAPLACGLDRHPDLEAWVTAAGGYRIPQLEVPGRIRSSGGPGLGVVAAGDDHG
jgi:L-alanine-DL-glutamate epimerase-like enolase superfamily enzyme